MIHEKKFRLAELLETYFDSYCVHPERKLKLEEKHFQAVLKIRQCRTRAMGYAGYVCEDCGEMQYIYSSCGHRFCPTCGTAATNAWATKVLRNLLNIKHHHVVVTLPRWLRPIAYRNKTVVYDLMFSAIGKVIRSWFEYKHGLEPGVISVLHTSGADLKYHPHLHLIVTGGGVDLKDGSVRLLQGDYLFRHSWLKRRFRWEFQQGLIAAFDEKRLSMAGRLKERVPFLAFLKRQNAQDWVVSIQESLADATNIVRYVGRYTKRACLSEYKIEAVEKDHITFRYNDYKHTPEGEKPREGLMRLHYVRFFDLLLQHVPEPGFVQVRYFGCYAIGKMRSLPEGWRVRQTAIEAYPAPQPGAGPEQWEAYSVDCRTRQGKEALWCRHCCREMKLVEKVIPAYWKVVRQTAMADSS